MKILSWNCNCKFREKFHLLDQYNADIMIIQECEDPKQSLHKEYKSWAKNYIWVGDNKHKGLGVFASKNINLKKLSIPSSNYKLFLPILINNKHTLIGVWTKASTTTKKGYINQLYNFLVENKKILDFSKIIIAGDWNSNAQWDNKRPIGNHSDVVRLLKEENVYSAYHYLKKIEHGSEVDTTFYLYRNKIRSFHIDYIFLNKNWLTTPYSFSVFNSNQWLKYSDHVPIVFAGQNS